MAERNKIVIGIDQSYQDTGISIAFNGKIKMISHKYLKNLESNCVKRSELQKRLFDVFSSVSLLKRDYDAEVIVIIERIRLQSQGFVNIDYIKSIGALNALIVDTAFTFDFPVYSVDTRAWKSAIIGTSKGKKNKYGIDEKKWPTILWLISKGFKDKIKEPVKKGKKKGVIEKDGERYTYNDNAADSACIALYGFVSPSMQLLKEEH